MTFGPGAKPAPGKGPAPNPLDYPMRRKGMDHDRYDFSMLADRKPITWPDGKSVALWVNVAVQFFPLDPRGQPAKVAGNMTMPYPDLRHYTLRDYGNRVGLYRVLDALDGSGARASFAVNTRLAERQPRLLADLLAREADEILCHGWDMDSPHATGRAPDAEAALVKRSVEGLREQSGRTIRGWLGPGKLQSGHTPEFLRKNGIDWFGDWVNDELPYAFRTDDGPLWAMPLSTELEDRCVLVDNLHPVASWREQVLDAFEFLLKEAEAGGGRMLALNLHPWVIGQPHRIAQLEQVLDTVAAHPKAWTATPSAILDHCVAQA